jgi:hypothetical protein
MDNRVVAFVPRESDRIRACRKENSLYREYSLIDLGDGSAPVVLRIYWPGTVAYACVWINAPGRLQGQTRAYARGAGRAGGGGYCKASAAAGAALADAGVRLEADIDGRGLESIRGALEALARWLDVPRYVVHVAHG